MSKIRALLVCLLAAVLAVVAEVPAVPSAQAAVAAPVTEVGLDVLGEDLAGAVPPADAQPLSDPAEEPVDESEPPAAEVVTPAGQVSISGALTAGETVTLALDGWAEGTTFDVQWLQDGVPIAGATGNTFTIPLTIVGAMISVQVTGTIADASPVTVVSAAGQVAPRPLTATQPRITGTAAVGSRLTASISGWSAGAALTYQWYAGSTRISGATARTFILTSAQAGRAITVRVTGRLTGSATESRASAPTPRVVTPGRVSITGTAATGQTLTARPTSWASGTQYRYQWLAGGTVINGATSRTLKLTSRQSGERITVRVVASRTGWASVERTSSATRRVMRSARPTVSGTLSSGFVLRARTGTWTTRTTFRYQWYADGSAIRGATRSTFRLTRAQVGDRITVRVTGSKPGHTRVAATSARTARVLRSTRPTISGQRSVGSVLTARTGTWTARTSLRYQWHANGQAIRGATSRTYRLSSSRQHQRITVTVTGSRSGYARVARTSPQTPRIARVGRPSISGSARVATRLTARTGTWTSGTRFRYQWYVDGSAVRGATGRTFTLRAAYHGSRVRVRVTGSRSGYATFSRTTAATARVVYPNRTAPATRTTCPAWAPIKGNEDSMIYHMRGQRFYQVTHPEECFRTESAARAAGYRKSKV